MSDRPGIRKFGKYEATELLGRGGMADVYRGTQPSLERAVAIKVIHPHLAAAEGFIDRFRREARLVASLRHPNIVQVIDFDVQDGVYFMVMEYIAGETLEKRLRALGTRGERMALDEVERTFTPLCDAIDYAHRQGTIHRDLKPSNVMFSGDGTPVLTDFGIAKIVGMTGLTMTGSVTGTPLYMAPEQAQGISVDARADGYSLGVILYEMVTGRVPFEGDTPFSVIMKHVMQPPPPPMDFNPTVPVDVQAVILRALSKKPDERYQTADELGQAFSDARRGVATSSGTSAMAGTAAATAGAAGSTGDAVTISPLAPQPATAPPATPPPATPPPPSVSPTESPAAAPQVTAAPDPMSRPTMHGGFPDAVALPVFATPVATAAPPTAMASEAALAPAAASGRPTESGKGAGTGGQRWLLVFSLVVVLCLVGVIGIGLAARAGLFSDAGAGRTRTATAPPAATTAVSVATATTQPPPPTTTQAPPTQSLPSPTTGGSGGLDPTPTATGGAIGLDETPTPTRPAVPEGMVAVPAGAFTMGSEQGNVDIRPQRTITMPLFWIDTTEVTNAQFVAFTEATNYRTTAEELGANLNWRIPEPGVSAEQRFDHPVRHISWNDAETYCAWADKRLPTSAEWEKAARGENGQLWPWGNDFLPEALNWFGTELGTTAAVGSYPSGASPFGVLDMAGNLWEWVSDYYDPGYYLRAPDFNPQGPDTGTRHVMRGGGYQNNFVTQLVTIAFRDQDEPTFFGAQMGFRCAQSPP